MIQNEMLKTESMKQPEQGRSMIEMLGTLAIMGVLSIGGIAGYGYAVTKYKANETIDELNKRAILYAMQLEGADLLYGTPLKSSEFGDTTTLGYGVSAVVSEYENEFNVELSSVPSKVCMQILKNYTVPVEISVNDSIYNDVTENVDICGENDTDMVFAFNNDLSIQWEEIELADLPELDCRWSGWLDSGKPNYTKDGGDYETLDGICGEGRVENIQCRAAGFPDTPLEDLEQTVVCNTKVGLVCHNKDQKAGGVTHIPACINYEINVYCCYPVVKEEKPNDNNKEEDSVVESTTTAKQNESLTVTGIHTGTYTKTYTVTETPTATGTETLTETEDETLIETETSTMTETQSPSVTITVSPEVTATVTDTTTSTETESLTNSLIETYETSTFTVTMTKMTEMLETTPLEITTPEICDGCSDNSDCNSGEYCHLEAKEYSSCSKAPTCGVCEKVGKTTPKTITGVGAFVKGKAMTWWNAQNYCEALNGRLARLSDFKCGVDFAGKGVTGYCNMSRGSREYEGQRSRPMQAFQEAYINGYYWLDHYSGCDSYYTSLSSGMIDTKPPYYDYYYYPLCRVGD